MLIYSTQRESPRSPGLLLTSYGPLMTSHLSLSLSVSGSIRLVTLVLIDPLLGPLNIEFIKIFISFIFFGTSSSVCSDWHLLIAVLASYLTLALILPHLPWRCQSGPCWCWRSGREFCCCLLLFSSIPYNLSMAVIKYLPILLKLNI